MEIKYLNAKRKGATLDFTYWYDLQISSYYDDVLDDYLDGKQWTGSINELLDNDTFHRLQTVAPKIICDIKQLTGFDEFDYVVIPKTASYNYFQYGVYALTNNGTILQYIGQIQIYVVRQSHNGKYRWTDVRDITFYPFTDPDENYVPVVRELVESIVVDGVTYTYSGHGNHFSQTWTNTQTNKVLYGYGERNPQVGWEVHDDTWQYYYIESVNYYPGVATPETINY